MANDKGKIKRGFSALSKNIETKGRWIADCRSCEYFYADKGKTEEYCHNKSVSKFDMCYDDDNHRTFCTYWLPSGAKKMEEL
jgi:hypothetical protein